MDRKLARKNLRAGLIAGAICAIMFGLTFVVSAIYLHS
jgi:sugar phosphate permease